MTRRPRPRPLVDAPVPTVSFSLPRRRRPTGDVALVVELLARELRGGATVPRAISAIAGDADLGLDELIRRVDDGAALGDELDRWCARLPGDDGVVIRAVLRLGLTTGAALADALDRAAAAIRDRRELEAELAALSAQSRASAVMIAAAPVAFLVVFGFADPAGVIVLTTTPLGWVCLVGGLLLDVAGFVWMRRLVEGVTA